MEYIDLMERLARTFETCDGDLLSECLAPNCSYVTEYGGYTRNSAKEILEQFHHIKTNTTDDTTYSCRVVPIDTVLANKNERLQTGTNPFAIILYHYSRILPAAVVSAMIDENGLIKQIRVSRDRNVFNVDFAEKVDDSPDDVPGTVKEFSSKDCERVRYLDMVTAQEHKSETLKLGQPHVWVSADAFIRKWMKVNRYFFYESKVFDDCIGYHYFDNGRAYTLYMYAFGEHRKSLLDGEYCKKLSGYPFSEGTIVLITYLHVLSYKNGKTIENHVFDYANNFRQPTLWHLDIVRGKTVLAYWPGYAAMLAMYRLMYAFNHDDRDMYDYIVVRENPAVHGYGLSGYFWNDAFFNVLLGLHKQYGHMRFGFVRYNDAVYNRVPYLGDHAFVSFSIASQNEKISRVELHSFDSKTEPYREFIKTEKEEGNAGLPAIPKLIGVVPLPPTSGERFALKLSYDDGTCRKYVLPLVKDTSDEAVSYDWYVFSDGIWKSAKVANPPLMREDGYERRLEGVCFANGFFLSGIACYMESDLYSEPTPCKDILFENRAVRVEHVWKWKVKAIYPDEETGVLKVLESGGSFNRGDGVATFADKALGRLSSLDFDYLSDYRNGFVEVSQKGKGYGFCDRQGQLVIPMKYDVIGDFSEGLAVGKVGSKWMLVDEKGNETVLEEPSHQQYQEAGDCYEGMVRVSVLRLRLGDLAFFAEDEDHAGIWGFVDRKGKPIVPPQYIFAFDFHNGTALVCKGTWTREAKWDNEYKTGKYWSEEMMWGFIDTQGNEVSPFIFDEVVPLREGGEDFCSRNVYRAHVGGYPNGKWGVINNRGKWLADPIFNWIGWEYDDGLFSFSNDGEAEDDGPEGIYDAKNKLVLREPIFDEVYFLGNGRMEVEKKDFVTGQVVKKTIDRDGNEYPVKEDLLDSSNLRHGLRLFEENGKYSIKDQKGNTLIEPHYPHMSWFGDSFLLVSNGESSYGLLNLQGETVLPLGYKDIVWCGNGYILVKKDEVYEMVRCIGK